MAELNGVPASLDEVRSLALTNYGHFTTMRVEDQRVRGLGLHMQRLVRDCREVFDRDLEPDRVRQFVRHALAGTAEPVVVRVTVFDPALELGNPGGDAHPHILVTLRPAPRGPLPALRLQAARYSRELAHIKHSGLFAPLHFRRKAQRNGFDDVVLTTEDSAISELATSNAGFVKGDRIVWPAADCLPGVTMRLLSQVRAGQVTTAPVTLATMNEMDAAFATNAAAGVRPVRCINDTRWPEEHPVLNVLRKEYADISAEPL